MRAVVQRVSSSKVTVDGEVTGEINKGLLVLLGVTHEATSTNLFLKKSPLTFALGQSALCIATPLPLVT